MVFVLHRRVASAIPIVTVVRVLPVIPANVPRLPMVAAIPTVIVAAEAVIPANVPMVLAAGVIAIVTAVMGLPAIPVYVPMPLAASAIAIVIVVQAWPAILVNVPRLPMVAAIPIVIVAGAAAIQVIVPRACLSYWPLSPSPLTYPRRGKGGEFARQNPVGVQASSPRQRRGIKGIHNHTNPV